MKIKEVLDYILEDDETPYGGVSFVGETVSDFIQDTYFKPEDLYDEDIYVLNNMLKECGIKTIEQ